jgi:hypothetical protein
MREKLSLEGILADFTMKDAGMLGPKGRQAVTIWLTPEDHARYERLQSMSKKRFSKKAREALLALIDLAEARAS